MIIGHGIDIVEIARIARLIDAHGGHFLERVFTGAERTYCDLGGRRRVEHYAARFAAKEAALKVLGTGWRGGIAWTDVEVTRDAAGRPGIRLEGESAQIAAQRGIDRWHVSLSHIETHAVASVIGESARSSG